MRNLVFISILLSSAVVFAQNDTKKFNKENENNRKQNTLQDSLMSNTYHLEQYKNKIEPVSETNMFQNPEDESTTWKNHKRDLQGNIIYDNEEPWKNNGKVRWQDAGYWSSREKQGMWEVAKLPYVSEDDVFWGKRVVRELILNEPSNMPLKYPRQVSYDNHLSLGNTYTGDEVFAGVDSRKNLITILMEAAITRQVNVYNSNLSRQYSFEEIKGSHAEGVEANEGEELVKQLVEEIVKN